MVITVVVVTAGVVGVVVDAVVGRDVVVGRFVVGVVLVVDERVETGVV